MNILNKTKCYLIGSMEYADGSKWRENISIDLNRIGIQVFDPYKKPFIDEDTREGSDLLALLKEKVKDWNKDNLDHVSKVMKSIRCSDLNLVDRSDFVIVYINPKIPSWGSAEELYWANREKKPIFVAIEGGKENVPLWLLGTLPSHYFYDSVDEVVETLSKINNGELKIDSSRWRLLKEEYR